MISPAVENFAIIVVNYGSVLLLCENLVPLVYTLPGVVVVVVDNFSTESERSAVTEICEQHGWQLEARAANDGFGAGMNIGVMRARSLGAKEFLLVNPDAMLTDDSVRALLGRVRSDPLRMVAPTIYRPDGSLWFGGSNLYLDDGRIRSLRRRADDARVEPWLSGACLMISLELWERVGGFSEEYFLYWEDVDLSHRVIDSGGSISVLADATAVHAEGGTQQVNATSPGTPKSAIYYYYNVRNRLLFGSRHLATADLLRWRSVTLAVAWEVLLQGGRRQFVRSPRPLIAAARGVRDGLRLARVELRRREQEEDAP